MRYELGACLFAVIPGHAGKPAAPDPGATDQRDLGHGDALATYEVEHTIPLAELVAANLRALGARVPVLTGAVSFTAAQANALAGLDAALSIHLNAGAGGEGFEVWHYPGSTTGEALARAIQQELGHLPELWLHAGVKFQDRGLQAAVSGSRARGFLAGVSAPAVLIEAGFVTNATDEVLIQSALYRLHVAVAVARGTAAVFGQL